MSKKYFTRFVTVPTLLVLLFLNACSSMNPIDPPPVKAAGTVSCGAGPAGDFGAKEEPGSYIALVNFPCQLLGTVNETDTQTLTSCGKNNVVTLVTSKDIHVHSIRLWMGAGIGSKFENGVCLEVSTPTGTGNKTFHREWDKHVEEHYSDAPFSVDFTIPAGSTVRLSRDPHGTIECKDAPVSACLTQEMAELWGE